MRYGTKALDDALLVLNPGSRLKTRKLDEKKRRQLSQLFFENVSGIICEIPEAAENKVMITKVDVPHHMTEIKVYWKAFGDTRDINVKHFLENNAEIVRRKLSETLYHSNVPKLVFHADREHLLLEEMNKLFEIADYGMQYRALSKTGAVLGSQKDRGEYTEEKKAKIPRFVLARRKKIEAMKRALAETEAKNGSEAEVSTEVKDESEVEAKSKIGA
ncbi:hypothetical protein FO519_005935 [Halicephalobus sp. NKZ332]|nr:hypothetical protein FO519_005935 [Halicephalobus sp. NKZ332]